MNNKILFITESDPIISWHIVSILENLKYHVTITDANGLKNYWDEIQSDTALVISVDYLNQEKTIEMTSQIKRQFNPKILLLSTLTEELSHIDLPYLNKPFTPSQILDKIAV